MVTIVLPREVAREEKRTKGVDNAFILLGDAGYATCPLPAITQSADTLKVMRASKSRNEKVPWK
jgi:hypothetical protein